MLVYFKAQRRALCSISSVQEWQSVAALAMKPQRQIAAISTKTALASSLVSHMRSPFLSIRHPSRQKEQANAVTEGNCLQAEAAKRLGVRLKL